MPRFRKEFSPEEIDKIKEQYLAGRSLNKIGREIHASTDTLKEVLTFNGVQIRPEQKHGSTRIDLTNQKFGMLLVIRYAFNNRWLCKCDCGKETLKFGQALREDSTYSCGCVIRTPPNPANYEEIGSQYWSRAQKHIMERDLEFKLTMKEAWDQYIKQDRKCALTGLPIKFVANSKKLTEQTASLDRIDSTKGYFPENIQWLHKSANCVKSAWTDEELIAFCKLVSDYNKDVDTSHIIVENLRPFPHKMRNKPQTS